MSGIHFSQLPPPPARELEKTTLILEQHNASFYRRRVPELLDGLDLKLQQGAKGDKQPSEQSPRELGQGWEGTGL